TAAWLAFLAVLAAWYAVFPQRRFLPALALVAYPAAAFLAGVRTFTDLGRGRLVYLAALAVFAAAFVGPARRHRPQAQRFPQRYPPPGRPPLSAPLPRPNM